MGKILPVEAVVGAAMLKNKGWLRGRICFENEVVYTDCRAAVCGKDGTLHDSLMRLVILSTHVR